MAEIFKLADVSNSVSLKNTFNKSAVVREGITVAVADWAALSDKAPFTVSASKAITETLTADSMVEVVGLDIVIQSNHGIVPKEETNGQNLIIYAVTQPTEDISFTALIRHTSEVIL
jgi:hypothetical protein